MWGADGLACHPLSGVLQVSFNNGEGWIIGKPPIMLHTAVSATCNLLPWRPRSVPTSSLSPPPWLLVASGRRQELGAHPSVAEAARRALHHLRHRPW